MDSVARVGTSGSCAAASAAASAASGAAVFLQIAPNPKRACNANSASSNIVSRLSSFFLPSSLQGTPTLRSSLQGTPTLRSSLRPSGPDDKPRQKPPRTVSWDTHVEVWRQSSQSVTWDTHVEVFVIPARERAADDCESFTFTSTARKCAPDACDPQSASPSRGADDCASRASTILFPR